MIPGETNQNTKHMKKIIAIALLAVALLAVGCEKDKPSGLKSGAELYVNIQKSTTKAMKIETRALPIIEGDPQTILTPREVVEQCDVFVLDDNEGYKNASMGISEEMRDRVGERLIMRGDMIVLPIDRPGKGLKKGDLEPYFLEARNVRIQDIEGKVIAYIPNSTMEPAWKHIKAAHDAGNYDKVYELFQEAYTAIPCTDLQYKALVERGEQ